MTSTLDLLARTDKWFLSAGEGLLWAPPFPIWLGSPGFWDDAHVFQYPVGPLFTVSFLDDAGRLLDLRPRGHRWTPAALETAYHVEDGAAGPRLALVGHGHLPKAQPADQPAHIEVLFAEGEQVVHRAP